MEYLGYKGIIPSSDTIKKWQFTRKLQEAHFIKVDKFRFPGMFRTEDIRNDRAFFWLSVFCEIGFLVAVSVMVGGVDLLLSFSALFCVALDFIGAYFHHKNQNEICRARLRYNIEDYKKANNLSVQEDVNKKEEILRRAEQNFTRRLGAALIILSALLKIAGSVILFEIPVFTIVLCVIYCFVAWIHINKTGYCIAYYRFQAALKKDLAKYITEGSNDEAKALNQEKDFDKKRIENIPADVELKEVKYYIFENTKIYDSLQPDGDQWVYRKWKYSFWDDATVMGLVNSKDAAEHVLSDNAKAFLLADIAERIFLNV